MRIDEKKSFLINTLHVTVILILYYLFFKFFFYYLLPFIIAFPVAAISQKYAAFFSKKIKIKKGVIAAFISISLYVLILLVFSLIIYEIFTTFTDIIKNSSSISLEIANLADSFKIKIANILNKISPEYSPQIADFISKTLKNSAENFAGYISVFATEKASKIPSLILSSIVTLVATCFIAKDFEKLKKFTFYLCGSRIYTTFAKVKVILFSSVLKLLKGYALLCFLTFSELFAGFLILRIKGAFVLALLISLIDVLPILGTGAVLIPWGIISILLNNTSLGISILVLYAFITIVRNFAEPKIIGNQIGIHPLFTLTAMFIGMKLFGFTGLLVLPITFIVVMEYYKAEINEEKELTKNHL